MPPGVVDMPSRKIIQKPFPIRFAGESMPVGNSRVRARLSSRSMSATSAIAAPKSATRAGAPPVLAIEPTQRTTSSQN